MTGEQARRRSAAHSDELPQESIVQQQFRDEVDVNTIVRRFGLTGQVPAMQGPGVYGDFTGITDYESALARIEETRERFMELPPEVREQFNNNPGELARYVEGSTEEDWKRRFGAPVEIKSESEGSGSQEGGA